MKIKIGLVGYYGWGNYGDEMFAHCLREFFPDFDFLFFHNPNQGRFSDNFEHSLIDVSAIIIGGGDLVIPWYLSWLYWDKRLLAKPVFIYGVGVPTWGGSDQNVIASLRDFFQHPSVKMISCRDTKSAQWISRNLDPQVSVSTSPDIVCSSKSHFRQSDTTSDICFIGRANNAVGAPVIAALKNLAESGYRIKHLMLGTNVTLATDLPTWQELNDIPRDIIIRSSEDELLTEIQNSRVVLSTKFHGCVSAYMSGIPSIALSTADKFVSFYESIGLADAVIGLDGKNINDALDAILINGSSFEQRMKLYTDSKNGLEFLGATIRSVVSSQY